MDNNPIANGLLSKGFYNRIIYKYNCFNYKIENPDGSTEYKDLSDLCVENIKNDSFDCVLHLSSDSTKICKEFIC